MLLTSCILAATTSHIQASEEIKEVQPLIDTKKEEAEQRIYALVWLLCAKAEEIKKQGPINDFQQEYEEIKPEILRQKLKNIIKQFPDGAAKISSDMQPHQTLHGKAMLYFHNNNNVWYLINPFTTLCELLEAGLDPLALLNDDVFKNTPTQELLKALHNSLKDRFPVIIQNNDENAFFKVSPYLHLLEFTEEECQEFLKCKSNNTKIQRCLPCVIPTTENKKQSELARQWISNRKNAVSFQNLFENVKTSIEAGFNLNQTMIFDGKTYTTPLIDIVENYYTDNTNNKLALIEYILNNGAKLDFVYPFEKHSQWYLIAEIANQAYHLDGRVVTQYLLKRTINLGKENEIDAELKEQIEKKLGKNYREDALAKPLIGASGRISAETLILTLLHYQQKLQLNKEKNSFTCNEEEIKNNVVPKILTLFYEKMSETDIDNELRACVKQYPDAAQTILNHDKEWNESYCIFEDEKENSYKLALHHTTLYRELLLAGVEPFALLKESCLWEHLKELSEKSEQNKQKATQTLNFIVQLTVNALYAHLFKAIKENDLALAKKTLPIYPYKIWIPNKGIESALETVTSSTNPELIKLLKEELTKRRLNATEEVWKNLEYFSEKARQNNISPEFSSPLIPEFKGASFVQVAEWCLVNGMNPNILTNYSDTPLTKLVAQCKTEPTEDEIISVIQLLLKYKVDLNAKDSSTYTAFEKSIAHNKLKVSDFLFKNGVTIDDRAKLYLKANKLTERFKNQPPRHWYKNPWIWTGIACGAGLAVWGAYAYLHKKPFVPTLLTRTILQLKQRVMSRFSTARINPSPSIHFPNGETLGMSGAVRVSGL